MNNFKLSIKSSAVIAMIFATGFAGSAFGMESDSYLKSKNTQKKTVNSNTYQEYKSLANLDLESASFEHNMLKCIPEEYRYLADYGLPSKIAQCQWTIKLLAKFATFSKQDVFNDMLQRLGCIKGFLQNSPELNNLENLEVKQLEHHIRILHRYYFMFFNYEKGHRFQSFVNKSGSLEELVRKLETVDKYTNQILSYGNKINTPSTDEEVVQDDLTLSRPRAIIAEHFMDVEESVVKAIAENSMSLFQKKAKISKLYPLFNYLKQSNPDHIVDVIAKGGDKEYNNLLNAKYK